MLKNILATNKDNWTALIARIAIAVVVFPHGAQKLFGWFGGGGLERTMSVFTEVRSIPVFLVILVLLAETIGPLMLLTGLYTRLAALVVIFNFIGIIIVDIAGNGFFMNWRMVEGKGEGYEFFILLFALLIISLVAGGGKASLDSRLYNKERSLRFNR